MKHSTKNLILLIVAVILIVIAGVIIYAGIQEAKKNDELTTEIPTNQSSDAEVEEVTPEIDSAITDTNTAADTSNTSDEADSPFIKARDAKRIADIKQLQSAIELSYSDGSRTYPTTTADTTWANLDEVLSIYLTLMPEDPVSSGEYVYIYSSNGEQYVIAAKLEDEDHSVLSNEETSRELQSFSASVSNAEVLPSWATENSVDCSVQGVYCLTNL